MTMHAKLPGADAPFDIVWDSYGIPHVYATTTADAFRGMGYAAGQERLWQIHQSTAYANCEAAALLGERFVAQDALQGACNVHGRRTGLPDSPGDWIVDAYLDGLNAVVDSLTDLPPEFARAGASPRHFTRADVAARYRFTSWFQHKTWTEKMALGRLMATHGVDWFREHVLHFSAADEAVIAELEAPLQGLDIAPFALAYPEAAQTVLSGSNNWAVTGKLSASGKGMLATDPHQPHSVPNTFFYVHLHAPDMDVFGAAFPGVPYFMMGSTRNLAWGLTTGFIDCYDVYIEKLNARGQTQYEDRWVDVQHDLLTIQVKGGAQRDISVQRSTHGPLLDRLTAELGLTEAVPEDTALALHWSLADVPTSAGALARLPLAENAAQFGDHLFEDDVCPLVNNIICVDRHDGLRRFIAATLPARSGVTGSVPLPGWSSAYDFRRSTQAELTVEVDPSCGYALTANNDTMGERGPFYIHNFPASSDRADRIDEILAAGQNFTSADFQAAQLDLKDLRAARLLPDLLAVLADSENPDVQLACALLQAWDGHATVDAAGPCLFYPFIDRIWSRKFMRKVLDEPVLRAIPTAAPGLSRFELEHFLAPGNPWQAHRDVLVEVVATTMAEVVSAVRQQLGADVDQWRWGDLHQIAFQHRLAGHEPWQGMRVGPDPIGGSATTLAMAMHLGPGPGRAKPEEVPCRVYHGPAFRLVVDLADPLHVQFVIAGGNGGRAGSPFATNLYVAWLAGEFVTVSLLRDELDVHATWTLEPS